MILYKLRVRVVHPHAYKPQGCDLATVTGMFWSMEYSRLVTQLEYDNGALDWIPVSDIHAGHYEVMVGGS